MEFSNPIAPVDVIKQEKETKEEESERKERERFTNADFRSMLMTPRAGDSKSGVSGDKKKIRPGTNTSFDEREDAAAKRRKKKLYYAKLKKAEEEREKELSAKYRDRATERRESKGGGATDADLAKTAQYKAVAPTADQASFAAERRRLAIQESKFLGGDMEHTHLVKGLDFALLQKVRSEIASKETEDGDEDEEGKDDKEDDEDDKDGEKKKEKKEKKQKEKEKAAQQVEKIEFQTTLGAKIHKAAMGAPPPKRNELFLPGRMAYVFDLEEDADSEIPTTTIRSKADCPVVLNQTTLTTNDIVINKLTQILSYLRQGMRHNKKMKRKTEKELNSMGGDGDAAAGGSRGGDASIFEDAGSYQTVAEKYGAKNMGVKKSGVQNYFADGGMDEEVDFDRNSVNVKDFVKNVNEKFSRQEEARSAESAGWAEVRNKPKETGATKQKKKVELNSYAECYPGAEEMDDAVADSDDEADYTKMDQGNKKGPVKRWDFENEEEYNEYMTKREALPKAAFQFGVKMAEGRKTRRLPGGGMSEKQKLDKEWQTISKMITKRKGGDGGEGGGKKSKEQYM